MQDCKTFVRLYFCRLTKTLIFSRTQGLYILY